MNSSAVRNLNGARRFPAAAILAATLWLAVHIPAVRAQLPSLVAPKFEVVSIKPIELPPTGPRPAACVGPRSPGRLTICANVRGLISNAYGFFATGHRSTSSVPTLVEGGPGWISSDMYVINARAEDTATQEMMLGPMMQTLLEDRFKLKLHRETRQVPVYDLIAAKNASTLRQHAQGNCTTFDPANRPASPGPGEKPLCESTSIGRNGNTVTVKGDWLPTDTFASGLYGIGALDRPVVNKTGLKDLFNLHLEFAGTFIASAAAPAADDSTLPSIFTALEEQLGLRLDPSKGSQEFLIIESVERPSEN